MASACKAINGVLSVVDPTSAEVTRLIAKILALLRTACDAVHSTGTTFVMRIYEKSFASRLTVFREARLLVERLF